MAPASPPPAGGRREQLLATAAELFLRRPYDEVTTTEIARSAGVAYGLIAHHFGNKRGLYLATIQAAADRMRSVRDEPPPGDDLLQRLRAGLARQIDYVDRQAEAYLALTRGGLGTDPDVRAIIDELRWDGARLILDAVGAPDPLPPALRTALRAWVGFFNDLLVDHLAHHDVPDETLVDLSVQTLAAALHTALDAAPDTQVNQAARDWLAGRGPSASQADGSPGSG